MRALARKIYLHAGSVLAVAFVVFAAAAFISIDIFDRVDPFDIGDPDSEVVRASDAFESATGRTAEPGVVLLVSPEPGVDAEAGDAAQAARTLRSTPGIAKVVAPESDPALVSADGTEALVLGYLASGAGRVEVGEEVAGRFASLPGVLAGGTAIGAFQVGVESEDDTRRLELYAAPVLLVLLLVVFRTVVAAMLPLLVAGLAILLTFATLRLITEFSSIDLFALQAVTGLGVGLAIDYSLFILARYREELLAGESYEQALQRTLQTAGRTVVFSSLTVAAALISLAAFPQPFLHSTGIAGALVAIFSGLTALLVLPAVLALLGSSVNRFAIRADPMHSRLSDSSGFWRRLPRAVCRRPVSAALVGALVMVALASQMLGIQLRTPDASELPSEKSARVVADSLVDFPGVPPTQLFAVISGPSPENLDETSTDLATIDGVTAVSPPGGLGPDGVQISISADVDPLSEEGQTLVTAVRERLPDGSLLGGRAAEQADQRSSILDSAPAVLALVVVTNLLILAAMTRSLLLPLLAVAVNLLTVAASLGTLAAAFTTEWTAGLLGTDVQPGIDMSVPVIAFAVGFGLSTDYGIFLFERIREERRRGRGEEEAIIEAVAATGRLISASALLLAIAVGAFAFSDLVIVKEFAVAIAVAVLLDATVVRGLLIPAMLKLLGRRAWWGPRWVARESSSAGSGGI